MSASAQAWHARAHTRAWWIAVLFMIGSACFAIGALPGYVSLVGVGADGITFFVGSIFFTSAGTLQFLEVANTSPSPDHRARPFRPASWEPRRIDWLATAVQLVGTVFFNVSTFRGNAGRDWCRAGRPARLAPRRARLGLLPRC